MDHRFYKTMEMCVQVGSQIRREIHEMKNMKFRLSIQHDFITFQSRAVPIIKYQGTKSPKR